jgi:hypothetical protein
VTDTREDATMKIYLRIDDEVHLPVMPRLDHNTGRLESPEQVSRRVERLRAALLKHNHAVELVSSEETVTVEDD